MCDVRQSENIKRIGALWRSMSDEVWCVACVLLCCVCVCVLCVCVCECLCLVCALCVSPLLPTTLVAFSSPLATRSPPPVLTPSTYNLYVHTYT
jgi:hypothetical protein